LQRQEMMRADAHRARQLQIAAENVIDLSDMFSVRAHDIHMLTDGTSFDHGQISSWRRDQVRSASVMQCGVRIRVPAEAQS
jgi:hypothetical protein